MFLERHTEFTKERTCFFIGTGRCHECDFHSHYLGYLVDIDFREYDLLFDSEGIVSSSVKFLVHTVEITDTREGNSDEPLKEFVHLRRTECHLDTDRHPLTEFEVGNILP